MQDGDIMTYTKIRFLHPQAPIELDWVVIKSSRTNWAIPVKIFIRQY